MIDSVRKWVGLKRCHWFARHTAILYNVGHNIGKECRWCGQVLPLMSADIAGMRRFLLGGEDEMAMEPKED